jgi:tetratricopeptide (TPR) repeat protein
MSSLRGFAAILSLLALTGGAQAGLYYSGEEMAELPSQWRGFLLDQRALRNVALKPSAGLAANPLRERYEEQAAKLAQAAAKRKLTADEAADLGALYVRLGEIAKAVEVLRAAQREYPHHFHIAASLGTAWQLQGDLERAAEALSQAVRLAPGKLQKAEEYHLKLVRLRQRQARDAQDLDDLFGIRYVGEDGTYQPGKLAAGQSKLLPSNAAAVAQQLALWLPADGRLLWQLAELTSAHGDVKTAAAILDGCVTEFGMNSPELRRHRQAMRAAADGLARQADVGGDGAQTAHKGHAGVLKPRSKRPLVNKLDTAQLPLITATGVNPLPWSVLADTTLNRGAQPAFSKYLRELDGKQISLSGFMQPLGEGPELATFMLIEYPVGCWYCEMPDMSGIVLVELPEGKTKSFTRGLVKVTGKLALNATDPESFLYTITKAKVTEAD